MYVYIDGQVKVISRSRSCQRSKGHLRVKDQFSSSGHLKVKSHFKVKDQLQDKLSNGHIFNFIAIEINRISHKLDVFFIDNSIFLTKALKVRTRSSTEDKNSNRKHRLTCVALYSYK